MLKCKKPFIVSPIRDVWLEMVGSTGGESGMVRFWLLLVMLILVVILAAREAPWVNAVVPAQWGEIDWRDWLSGGRMPRVEEGLARLEREHKQAVMAMQAELSALTGQVQALQAVADRLDALESGTGQLRLENGTVAAKQDDPVWRLTSIFTRVREFRGRVEFVKPFAQPPQVVMGIVMLDFNQDKIRFQASAEAIDAQGFTVLFSTQVEERPREVRVEWLAFGR